VVAAVALIAPVGSGVLVTTAPAAQAAVTVVVQASESIQAAIHAASSGDTIRVEPGTYFEHLDFEGKAIIVESTGGPSQTVLDGGGAAPVVVFGNNEPRTAVLRGFTIQHGATPSAPFYGGGISVRGASPTIELNVVQSNTGIQGGGIGSQFGAPAIRSNVVRDNISPSGTNGYGGGINVSFASSTGSLTPEIVDNVIEGNHADQGGGLGFNAPYSTLVMNNVIRNNVANYRGGALVQINTSLTRLVQNLITGNTAGEGAALYLAGNAPSQALSNTVVDNLSRNVYGQTGLGATVYQEFGVVNFANNLFIGPPGTTVMVCSRISESPAPSISRNDVFAAGGPATTGPCQLQVGMNGNVSVDPLLAGDYHLSPGSPAIDAGDNTPAGLPARDLDGNERRFDGDANGSAIADLGVYEVVRAGETVTRVSSTSNPAGTGTPVTLTATVSAATGAIAPSGTVQYHDGAATIGPPVAVTPSATPGVGTAQLTTSFDSIGNHTITAAFISDSAEFGSSASDPYVQEVRYATNTTVNSTPNPSASGGSVTFTATVTTPGPTTPTGSVQFRDGSSNLGTPQGLTPGATAGTAVATVTTTALSLGSHTITAVFAPSSSSYMQSAASPYTHVVQQAETTVVITQVAATTILRETASFIATVTAVASTTTPDGIVQFREGTTNLGDPVFVNATGTPGTATAFFQTNTLGIGSHQITAAFTPFSSLMKPSTSNPVVQNITYEVTYLYDTALVRKVGEDVHVKVQLRDVWGANLSASTLPVTASCLVPSDATSCSSPGAIVINRPFSFRKDKDQPFYDYEVRTKGAAPGDYSLLFVAFGDPVTHAAPLQLKK
jgi:hypothetical protein